MKRNNFYMMIMAAMMCMASVNVNAQGRRGGDFRGGRDGYNPGGHNREMVMHHDGRMEMRGGRHNIGRHGRIDIIVAEQGTGNDEKILSEKPFPKRTVRKIQCLMSHYTQR